MPTDIRAAVLSRGDAIAEATTCSNSRSNRKWRSLGIALWSFLIICSLNFNWFGQGYLGLDTNFGFVPSPAQDTALDHISRSVTYFLD